MIVCPVVIDFLNFPHRNQGIGRLFNETSRIGKTLLLAGLEYLKNLSLSSLRVNESLNILKFCFEEVF